MERIKDLIKEYLLNTIQTKKNMIKRIYELEKRVKEADENEHYALQQKEIYKQKCKKQSKTIIELRKKLKEKK